jgi:hypothetical protein
LFTDYLAKINDPKKVESGVDMVVSFRQQLSPFGLDNYVNGLLKALVAKKEKQMETATDKTSLQEQINYIKAKMEADDKKGF